MQRLFSGQCLIRIRYSYFAEIEQAGFTPSHMVDGWAPSADPVLQARLFSYPGMLPLLYLVLDSQDCILTYPQFCSDTHRYRLGVNHMVCDHAVLLPSVRVAHCMATSKSPSTPP